MAARLIGNILLLLQEDLTISKVDRMEGGFKSINSIVGSLWQARQEENGSSQGNQVVSSTCTIPLKSLLKLFFDNFLS